MSFKQHAAIGAVASLVVASLVGLSSPGFASELANAAISTPSVTALTPINGDSSVKFPTTPTPEVPGVTVEKLPGDDLSCLAGAIYFESKGEPLSGQLAVADVIINRTKSDRFPSSICGVVKQPGQFSFVRHGEIPHIDTDRASYRTAMAVAQIAMGKSWNNPAPTALFFHAKRVKPGWGFTQVASIGHHVFYR